MTFSVRPYYPGDEESIVALWNTCLPRDLIASAVFQKYYTRYEGGARRPPADD